MANRSNAWRSTAAGIPGDRASALFVRSGHARVGKTYRAKEHDRLHLLEDEAAAVAAAAQRGVEAEMRGGEHFFDDAPVSIFVDRWLAPLNEHVGYPVEWERFRPNFFVRAGEGFAQSESDLVDARLRLGTVRLRVRCPIERCVAVTYHPGGEPSDPRHPSLSGARAKRFDGNLLRRRAGPVRPASATIS